ncbi:Uma2 family endonuclease [Streptomyces sp. SAI-170]|uniref:Uma2 family endonuclease n=1 Tax=Streptomyces sp. SAI-170 TaxID=3377729 RepID=UPI003C7B53C1
MDPITQKILLDWFVDLDTPEGLRLELVEGDIVVTPVPDGHHEHCVSQVVHQMLSRSGTDLGFSGNKGLLLRNADGCPQDHVIPDGTLVPHDLGLFRGAAPWMPCEGVAMVLEVTNSRPAADREVKRRCYARGGIPFYLLVDRDTARTTLFGAPETTDYQEIHEVAFGKPLPLPAPFSFDLETADFL